MTQTYGQRKKAWASRWALMRREYLDGRLLDALVLPDGDGVRWECPLCGEHGTTITSERLAVTAGRGHMNVHVSDEDREALEDLKVTTMPEDLLTPFQRRRRDALAQKPLEIA